MDLYILKLISVDAYIQFKYLLKNKSEQYIYTCAEAKFIRLITRSKVGIRNRSPKKWLKLLWHQHHKADYEPKSRIHHHFVIHHLHSSLTQKNLLYTLLLPKLLCDSNCSFKVKRLCKARGALVGKIKGQLTSTALNLALTSGCAAAFYQKV